MSLARRIVVLACAIVIAVTHASAGGFQLNEHGARAMAQAGAFAARAYDGSAIYFNPAGLGFQTGGSLYLGGTIIMPKSTFYGPLELNSSQKTDMKSQTFTPINVYASYPIMDNLVVGIGVNNPYGLGTEWPSDWVGRFISTKVDLQSFFFSPTVSYRVNDNFSIGAGFNYVTGKVTINRSVAVTSVALPQEPTVNLDLSGTGVGFNVGLLYKFTPELSAGVSYRHSVKIKADGDATFNPNYAVLALPQGPASASITLPATGFFGIAYKPMKNLEVEADVQFIGWSSYDTLAIDFTGPGVTADKAHSSSDKKYKDTYILRLGGEYNFGTWQLRAGYYYDNSPVQDAYMEPLLPDASRHGLNIGAGYKFSEHLSVDVAYLFIKFLDRTITNSISTTSLDGTYKSNANLFAINLGYSF